MIVKQGRCFQYMIGGMGNSVFGFAKFHDNWRPEHPSSVRRHPALILQRRYTSEVQVRRNSIRTLLDGQPVTELTRDFDRFTPATEARISDGTMLGVLAHNCVVVVHSAVVREVEGKGTLLRMK